MQCAGILQELCPFCLDKSREPRDKLDINCAHPRVSANLHDRRLTSLDLNSLTIFLSFDQSLRLPLAFISMVSQDCQAMTKYPTIFLI